MSDLRKGWLSRLFGGRRGWTPPPLPGNFTRGPGGIGERRRGWGSVFQPSNVPGARPLRAVDNGTSGSTIATEDSPALQAWRGEQARREGRARRAWSGGGLFRGVGAGELAKREAGKPLSPAELEQRREAARGRQFTGSSAQDWAVGGAIAAGGAGALLATGAIADATRPVRHGLRYARWLHDNQAQYGRHHKVDSATLAPGETLIYRGSPEVEAFPTRRSYNAVFFAENPRTSRSYTPHQGGGGHAAYALQPGTRLFSTGPGAEETTLGRRVAEAQMRGWVRANGLAAAQAGDGPSPATYWREVARADLRKPDANRHALSLASSIPMRLTERYLRRAGYDGIRRDNGNIALFDLSRVRRIGESGAGADPRFSLPGIRADPNEWRRGAVTLARTLRRLRLRRSVGAGDLAKRAGDGVITEAERAQRVAAGKASGEKRRARAGAGPDDQPRSLPGGPKFSPTRRSIYSQYRPKEAPEAAPPLNPRIDPASVRYPAGTRLSFPEKGPFVLLAQRPQVPEALGEAATIEIGRWAAGATREARPLIYERAEAKGLIPAGADPMAVRAAYNHARNLALHDVGLFAFDWRNSPEGIEELRPLIPFMRYTRDSLQNVLLSGRPGEWAPFRREFGQEFPDGRTYQHDTRGQKAGEKKRAFERHLHFLKDPEGKSPALRQIGRRRVEKLAKAWTLAPGRGLVVLAA